MFTAGGSHARLFRRQGTDLRIDMVCKLVPFFMPWKHGYGFLQSTYRICLAHGEWLKLFRHRFIIIILV